MKKGSPSGILGRPSRCRGGSLRRLQNFADEQPSSYRAVRALVGALPRLSSALKELTSAPCHRSRGKLRRLVPPPRGPPFQHLGDLLKLFGLRVFRVTLFFNPGPLLCLLCWPSRSCSLLHLTWRNSCYLFLSSP